MNDRIFFSSKSDVFLFYNAGMAYFSKNLTELISCKLFEGKKFTHFFFFIKWLSITCSRRNSQIVFRFIQTIFLSVGVRTFWFNVSLSLSLSLSISPLPPKFQNPEKMGPSHRRHASWGSLRHDMVIFHIQVKFMS